MKLPSWILFWIFFVQAVSGLNIFEDFLKDFLVDLIRGPRYLEDFPRCGKPGKVKVIPAQNGAASRKSGGGVGNRIVGGVAINSNIVNIVPGSQGCSSLDKCDYGEGQCSGDFECRSPFVCGADNCKDFTYGEFAEGGWDCCTIDSRPPSLTDFSNDSRISSEGYPVTYSNNTDNTWTITSTSGPIEMTIHYFELEDSGNCVYDGVEIVANGLLRYKYCGNLTVPWVRTFSGPTLDIRFYSDESVTRPGFLSTFYCGSVPCTKTGPTPAQSDPGLSGTCSSPNYPGNYQTLSEETDLDCIPTPGSGNYFEIIFQDMVIESPYVTDPTNCPWDWVRIEEETNGITRPLLSRTCGTQLPGRIASTLGSKVSVFFFADNIEYRKGFSLVWNKISEGAGGGTGPVPVPTPGPGAGTGAVASCIGALGQEDCCSVEFKCNYGQGDCDNDDQCANGLR